jgi:zinc finger protein
MEQLKDQQCPICQKNKLTLTEDEQEVPYFGKIALFSMQCEECGFKKADIETTEPKEPCRYSLEISSEEDLKIRVVKSSEATIKIPYITDIEPGPASEGYVTNVEGVLNRVKDAVESMSDSEEEPEMQKKCKNMLKKIQRAMWGREKIKMIIEDPTGNSAIISEKAEKTALKIKKDK